MSLLKTPPLVLNLFFYCSLCVTLFDPNYCLYQALLISYLVLPPFLFYLLNMPQVFWRTFLTPFFLQESFPNSFPHWSFTYLVLFPRTYVNHYAMNGYFRVLARNPKVINFTSTCVYFTLFHTQTVLLTWANLLPNCKNFQSYSNPSISL